MARAIAWLRSEQEADGSWFGRWGTNYIYGTWSVLTALDAAGIPAADPAVRRAITWLKRSQVAIWLAAASEIAAATQMAPDRATVVVLVVNAGLLAAAILVARVAAGARAA